MKFRYLLFVLGVAACSGNPEQEEAYDLSNSESISANVPGMTVWVSNSAVPDWRYDQRVWIIEGRTSKNIASAFSFSADDEFGEAIVTSARKFEVVLDNPSIVHLLQGNALHVEIHTTTGTQTQYFASLSLAPKFGEFSGSSKIYLIEAIDPVVVGGDALFRGRASLSSGVSGLDASAGDAAPEGFFKVGSKWAFDWTWPNMILAAEADEVSFTANSSYGTVEKDAVLSLATTLTLQTAAPEQPDFTCKAAVSDCLEALSNEDASACGTAREVKNCIGQVKLEPGPQRFAHDLISYLYTWYWDHAADVTAGGGQPLMLGLAGVHAASVEEITDPGDDPHGHDLTDFIVLSHPDPVFPGSDNRWYGAYDRQTGQLQSVYGFN